MENFEWRWRGFGKPLSGKTICVYVYDKSCVFFLVAFAVFCVFEHWRRSFSPNPMCFVIYIVKQLLAGVRLFPTLVVVENLSSARLGIWVSSVVKAKYDNNEKLENTAMPGGITFHHAAFLKEGKKYNHGPYFQAMTPTSNSPSRHPSTEGGERKGGVHHPPTPPLGQQQQQQTTAEKNMMPAARWSSFT